MLKGKALHSLLFLLFRPEYCVLPVQAIRCELAGIEPVGELSMLASLKALFTTLCGTFVVMCVVLLCTLHCVSR